MYRAEIFSRQAGMTLAGAASSSSKPLVLAIGVFDGVHKGHRKLLAEAVHLAAGLDAVPVALTFDPHPRSVLHPSAPVVLLMDLAERIRLLRENGMAMAAVADFTPEFANTLPQDFLEILFAEVPRLAGVVVGSRWRFGKGGAGDVELLAQYAAQKDFVLSAVEELVINGQTVSASTIRRLIASGKLEEAAELLGAPYTLAGTVANGYGIAGSKLDCPTANIEISAGVLPPDGVYAGSVKVDGKTYIAAVNIGVAPTYGRPADARRRIEAHLLDFSGNLYGKRVHLQLGRYLRSEQCFANEEELRKQIAIDVENIRRWAEKTGVI